MTTEVMADREVATRDRLALALDVDDLVEAIRLARILRPWFGTAKVGLELFSASGPEAIGAFAGLGYRVFLDLKMHDIPTTVHRAARVVGALGIDYLTLHAQGGVAMLRAGVEGLAEGAEGAGLADAHCAGGHDPHERRRRSRAHPAASGSVLQSRAAAAASCARRAMCATPRSSPRGSRSSCPASGRKAPRITIRPAPRHLGTRSIRVPICSSSDGPSRRRQTRPQPRLPSSHPSPETPDFLANSGLSRPARAKKTSVACRGVRPEKAPR